MIVLERDEVDRRRAEYRSRVGPAADARQTRRLAGTKDPVADFLFEYYSFPPGKLRRWSPGLNVILVGMTPEETDDPSAYIAVAGGCMLDAHRFRTHRIAYLRWAITYLESVQAREPYYGCFGLHEWAMVYRTDAIRHDRIPLRLGNVGTDTVVSSRPLTCTHYDAFRFFMPDATPLNRTALTRENSIEHDQPGCIHATMDLYKFCYKITPFVISDIMADAFLLAAECRIIDMRASPYDFTEQRLEPIRIETLEGREEYIAEQRRLAEMGQRVRADVLAEYSKLEKAVADEPTGSSRRSATKSHCVSSSRSLD